MEQRCVSAVQPRVAARFLPGCGGPTPRLPAGDGGRALPGARRWRVEWISARGARGTSGRLFPRPLHCPPRARRRQLFGFSLVAPIKHAGGYLTNAEPDKESIELLRLPRNSYLTSLQLR